MCGLCESLMVASQQQQQQVMPALSSTAFYHPRFPPQLHPQVVPVGGTAANLSVLCIAPLCVFPFCICELFSEITRLKQELEGNNFYVNGILLAFLGSINFIQLGFSFSGWGLSMSDLEGIKWRIFEKCREVAEKFCGNFLKNRKYILHK